MKRFCFLIVGFMPCVAAAMESAQAANDPPVIPETGLAVSAPGQSRRSSFSIDPIAEHLIAGDWTMPLAGDIVTFKAGPSAWHTVTKGKDDEFILPGRGGYLALEVDAREAGVMLLEAAGHTFVVVNGTPRAGDSYEYGYVKLPIVLQQGANTLLFQVSRGNRVTARLTEPPARAWLNPLDPTLPDLIVGQPSDAEGAIVVGNASASWSGPLEIMAQLPGGPTVKTPVAPLPPLSVRKVGFRLEGPPPTVEGEQTLALALRNGASDLHSTTLPIGVRTSDQARKVTFRSRIDGSLQYYGYLAPRPDSSDQKPQGLILTLHGASVEAIGQTRAYGAKSGLHLVAPTNRRPFGFDWEDWGRLDAIEVLDLAQSGLKTDPQRTYLTGHSMGGHGTWHLGVTYPDRFAAIAPSAGWISMRSYAGVERVEKNADRLEALFDRAKNPSDTLGLVRNLTRRGVYILHGDADDNVPVDQARTMRQTLGEFHPDFAYHEQPGAGHWWGNECVDWPPLIDFLTHRERPLDSQVNTIEFTTMSPGVSSTLHWASIEAQREPLAASSVQLTTDRENRRIRGTTRNVARLAIDLIGAIGSIDPAVQVTLDGQDLRVDPAMRRAWLAYDGSRWSLLSEPPSRDQKGPHRQGPFKEAFRHRFVLVAGTKGTDDENRWALARARYDAETFYYRGNGSVDLVLDTEFLAPSRQAEFQGRSVILYGHAESNAAWPVLLGQSPVQVNRGRMKVGETELTGDDLACLFLRPRPRTDAATVGVVAGTGLPGLRLTERLPYFVSGVAYPDCSVFRAGSPGKAAPALEGTGFFGLDWEVKPENFAWKED